jgi:osmotically-inducible protein OsmY
MNKKAAGRMSGAMFVVAIASCATYANAQTGLRTPADFGGQMLAVSTSSPGTRPDTSVVRDVRRALGRVPEMDDSEIHIRVSHGVVTLTGRVPETWQISRAGNAARSVLGVRSVRNRLEVREEGSGK